MTGRRIPTTISALAVALAIGACGASKAEIRRAKRSGYRADYSVVLNAVVAAVSKKYPRTADYPTRGKVSTGWHSLWISKEGPQGRARTVQTPNNASSPNAFGQESDARTRYFVRFDVHVFGGSPWRVRVEGYAQKWQPGEVAVDLRGGDEPPWLKGRIDALYLEIYRRLGKYAVLMESEAPSPKRKLDTRAFAGLPGKAGEALAQVLEAARARDHERLRAMMTNDFKWSLGASGDATAAIAMWKADTAILPQLIKVIEKGCRADPDGKRVTCPPSFIEQPGYLGYRLGLVPGGDGCQGCWKMSFFVTGD